MHTRTEPNRIDMKREKCEQHIESRKKKLAVQNANINRDKYHYAVSFFFSLGIIPFAHTIRLVNSQAFLYFYCCCCWWWRIRYCFWCLAIANIFWHLSVQLAFLFLFELFILSTQGRRGRRREKGTKQKEKSLSDQNDHVKTKQKRRDVK